MKKYLLLYISSLLTISFAYAQTKEELKVQKSEKQNIAERIESNFITMDVAKKKNGGWIIMELGDGQVAGLPENANKNTFYSVLKRNCEEYLN
jgi:hypothetical protein